MSKRSVPSFGAYNPDRHHQKEELASFRDTLTEVNDKYWADQVEIQRESGQSPPTTVSCRQLKLFQNVWSGS
jgi:hypothetical protein